MAESLLLGLRDLHDITVANSPGPFTERLLNSGFTVAQIPALARLNREKSKYKTPSVFRIIGANIRLAIPILQIIRKKTPAIIHVNNFNAFSKLFIAVIISRMVKKLLQKGPLWILSRHDLSYHASVDRLFDTWAILLSDKVVPVCLCVKNHLVNNVTKSNVEGKLYLIYNGIDTNRFSFSSHRREGFRKNFGISNEAIVFSMVGRISPSKGVHWVVDAFCRSFGNKQKPVCLVLAGDILEENKNYFEFLQKIITQNNCHEKVQFLRKIEEVENLYSGIDIAINYSSKAVSEALPLSVIEAMSCGRIVIAGAIGGLVEIIDNGINGYLIESESEEKLSQKMVELLSRWNELECVRLSAREKAVMSFSRKRMIKEYDDLYLKAIA